MDEIAAAHTVSSHATFNTNKKKSAYVITFAFGIGQL